MNGLREDAGILFVLTTNRPDQLEEALTSRPGRIDQAIEIPLPDEGGRRKLIQFQIETGGQELAIGHVEAALDEMIFHGGSLDAKLLGFSQNK